MRKKFGYRDVRTFLKDRPNTDTTPSEPNKLYDPPPPLVSQISFLIPSPSEISKYRKN